MKLTSDNKIFIIMCLLVSLFLTGCGSTSYSMAYKPTGNKSAFTFDESKESNFAKLFANDLAVLPATGGISSDSIDLSSSEAAILCGVDSRTVYVDKNATETLDPASLTKVLTAIIALEHGNLSDTITANSSVNIDESGASKAGIEEGDSLTLDQALYALLLPSGNDAAMLIADHIAGSGEAFADMMNEKAHSLGATGCHFVNPHGLTADDHYVTAYDVYLIFNEAIKHEDFVRIISTVEYSSIYHDKVGNPKDLSFQNTNLFLNGTKEEPEGITVIGGKTGTTNKAGSCLVLLSRDVSGRSYISVILKSNERETLYDDMYKLLSVAAAAN